MEQSFLVLGQNRSIQMITYILKDIEQQLFNPKSVNGSLNEQNCIMTFFFKSQTFLLHINHSQAVLYSYWFSRTMSGTPENQHGGHRGVFLTNNKLLGPKVSKKLSLLSNLAYFTHFRTQEPEIFPFKGPIVKYSTK